MSHRRLFVRVTAEDKVVFPLAELQNVSQASQTGEVRTDMSSTISIEGEMIYMQILAWRVHNTTF